MSASGDRAASSHSIQKFLLIRARFLARKFYFDIDGPSIRNTMAHDIALTMVTDVHDAAVFREELTYRMVPRHAAVLTEGHDDLVL
jgi:hypothetical protein